MEIGAALYNYEEECGRDVVIEAIVYYLDGAIPGEYDPEIVERLNKFGVLQVEVGHFGQDDDIVVWKKNPDG